MRIAEAQAAKKAAIQPSTPVRSIAQPTPATIAPQMAKLAVTTPSAVNMSPALSPTPSHYEPLTTDSPSARNSPSPPSDNEEITYEEAKKRQEERALAALQCSIDNKEGE